MRILLLASSLCFGAGPTLAGVAHALAHDQALAHSHGHDGDAHHEDESPRHPALADAAVPVFRAPSPSASAAALPSRPAPAASSRDLAPGRTSLHGPPVPRLRDVPSGRAPPV